MTGVPLPAVTASLSALGTAEWFSIFECAVLIFGFCVSSFTFSRYLNCQFQSIDFFKEATHYDVLDACLLAMRDISQQGDGDRSELVEVLRCSAYLRVLIRPTQQQQQI